VTPSPAEILASVATGLGLAAACGFRVFVPLLAVSLAARAGLLPLSPDLSWMAGTPALIAFTSASVLEAGAYHIPWLDHALDTIATPAAIVCGVIASASAMGALPEHLRWAVAIIGGGGAAGVVQGATVILRLKSALLSGGIANPFVASAEFLGSAVTSILSILIPIVIFSILLVGCIVLFVTSHRFVFGKGRAAARPLDS
jgi:hypothetical protein